MKNNAKISSSKSNGPSKVNSNAFFLDDLVQSSSLPENGSSSHSIQNGDEKTNDASGRQDSWTSVYICDHELGWRPAELINDQVNVEDKVAPVLLYQAHTPIPTPSILREMDFGLDDSVLIDLSEYWATKFKLPRRNVRKDGEKIVPSTEDDLVDMHYLHEPGILYNLKYRLEGVVSQRKTDDQTNWLLSASTSSSKGLSFQPSGSASSGKPNQIKCSPYTRVAPGGNILLAVNPFKVSLFISSNYSANALTHHVVL